MPYSSFVRLLRRYDLELVLDVRSVPYSKRAPQYGRAALRRALKADGIRYRFAGNVLGGRPATERFYVGGQVQYALIAGSSEFAGAISRLRRGVRHSRIVLMCSEAEPLACHRFLLLARHLSSPDLEIIHILPGGAGERHLDTERRLVRQTGVLQPELFGGDALAIDLAYAIQSERVAFAARTGDLDYEGTSP